MNFKKNVLGVIIAVAAFCAVLFSVQTAFAQEQAYSSISFNRTELNLGAGESAQLAVYDSNGAALGGVSFTSTDSAVAAVDANGIVYANAAGSCTVAAFDGKGYSCQLNVSVYNAPSSIKLNYTSVTVGVGESLNIGCTFNDGSYADNVSYSSSDANVVAIDADGNITPNSVGNAYVYCTAYNGVSASCHITVKSAPASVKILNSDKTIVKGWGKYKLKTSISGTAHKITYTSSNTSVITVNSKGELTAKGYGKAVVTVSVYNGKSASATFTVVKESKVIKQNKKATQASYKYGYVDKYVFGKTVNGRNLEAFIITPKNGKYTKTYVMTFTIHGFEDCYAHDGLVLTEEGNKVVEYYANNPSKLKNFRLVIIPCLNPDGAISGKNNKRACKSAYGRCTAKHVDMNRDFVSGRFRAKESKALVNLLKKYKPNVFTDFHGWLNETLGSSSLCSIFDKNMKLGVRMNGIYAASSGYLYGYVHYKYNCPSVLVEYKSPGKVSHKQTYTSINKVIEKYNKK